MSDLLNLGASALLANQSAIQVTGQNIANVNTTGYARETAILAPTPGQYTSTGYYGNGVQVSTVQRIYNAYLAQQANAATSVQSSTTAQAKQLSQLESVFQSGSNGLGAAISNLLSSFSAIASAPTSQSARTATLSDAQQMASQFQNYSAQLTTLQQGVTSQVGTDISTVNALAKQLASINQQIQATNGSGQNNNELLDQRDALMTQLNGLVQTSTTQNSDGSTNIFIGNQPLVVGANSNSVSLAADPSGNPDASQLAVNISGNSYTVAAANIGGGEIAGLLSYQNTSLDQMRTALGSLAYSMANALNQQQNVGVDLNGNAGSNMFSLSSVSNVYASSTNTDASTYPSSNLSVSVTNASQMVGTNYQLSVGTGGTISVTRVPNDGTVYPTFASGTPVTVDGLKITLTGSPAVGDSFVVKPYENTASGLKTAISSTQQIAAAGPVASSYTATLNSNNTGSVVASSVTPSPSTGSLSSPFTVQFTSATTYNILGTGTGNPTGLTYTPGSPITYNGVSAVLTGTPAAGDSVSVGSGNMSVSSITPSTATQTVTPAVAVNPLTPINVTFTSATTFTVTGNPTPQTYTAGQAIVYNGWSLQLSGTPKAGDTIAVQPPSTSDLSSNGSNATALAALSSATIASSSTSASATNANTLGNGYATLLSQVGVMSQAATYNANVATTQANSATAAATAVSGVNLDEEAANLLKFQQAYQASAQIIQTAQTIFNSLLTAVGASS